MECSEDRAKTQIPPARCPTLRTRVGVLELQVGGVEALGPLIRSEKEQLKARAALSPGFDRKALTIRASYVVYGLLLAASQRPTKVWPVARHDVLFPFACTVA